MYAAKKVYQMTDKRTSQYIKRKFKNICVATFNKITNSKEIQVAAETIADRYTSNKSI